MAATNLLFANNAQTTVSSSIGPSSVAVSVAAGTGALFPNPNPSNNEYFVATFTDASTGLLREIVWVTGRSGDTMTIVRAREGTAAQSWTANDLFAELWTAGQAESMLQLSAAQAQAFNFGQDSGTLNTYLCALNPVVAAAPGNGFPLRMIALNTNTGASTLDAGFGAVAVKRRDGSALIGGEIQVNHLTDFTYNATAGYWEVMEPAAATSAAVVAGTDSFSFVTPAQLANFSSVPTGFMVPAATLSAPSGWLLCYGQAVSRSTYAPLFAAITKSSTVTITIAVPGVVTWASHLLSLGDVISFETTGALPTGLSIATDYYAVPINANSFNIATSMANALAGTLVTTTGSQSGVQTCRQNPYGCGNGSTTFNIPDARDRVIAGWTGMGGTPANLLGNNASVGGFSTAARGNAAGQTAHTQTVPELVAHTHTMNDVSGSNAGSTGGPVQGSGVTAAGGSTGGGGAFNVTQPTLLANYMIKT